MRKRILSLRARLFRAFALVTLIAVAIPGYFFYQSLYQDRLDAAGKEALALASFAGELLAATPTKEQVDRLFSAAAKRSYRMTLTGRDGTVLRDSHLGERGLHELDNHNDRPEIAAARSAGTGISLRRGNTLGVDAVYAAVTLEDGTVLRVAVPLAGILHSLAYQLPAFLAVLAGVGLFCLVLSALITGTVRRRMDAMAEIVAAISRDTGRGRRLRDVRWREMRPLALAVNHMADTIDAYVAETSDQQGQLETILDSMHEGVLVLGPGGGIRRWNRALARLFPDIAKAEGGPVIEGIPCPALQRRVDAMLGGESRPHGADGEDGEDGAGGQHGADDGGGSRAIHFELPTGRFLVAHVSRPAGRGESLGLVIVVYDATEIMRLERVRRDFVSNVSHELRTPLTAISGYAEVLAESEDLGEEHGRFAAIIHRHAASLAGIINDLLALARIEDMREAVSLEAMDAQSAVHDAVSAIRDRAEAKGIAVRLDLEPGPVLANAGLLAQVFRNLLENACRYSPQGGEIRVSSSRKGEEILFRVGDDGPGIPEEALPRIFERFYQVKKERNSGTSGIGLAICKHIIERHGGRIWAESPHGDAATAMLFTLRAASDTGPAGDTKE